MKNDKSKNSGARRGSPHLVPPYETQSLSFKTLLRRARLEDPRHAVGSTRRVILLHRL